MNVPKLLVAMAADLSEIGFPVFAATAGLIISSRKTAANEFTEPETELKTK